MCGFFCPSAGTMGRRVWSSTPIHRTSLTCGGRRCCRTQRTRGRRGGNRRYVWTLTSTESLQYALLFFSLHSTLEECTFDTLVAAIDQGARDEQWGCEYTNTEVSEKEEMKWVWTRGFLCSLQIQIDVSCLNKLTGWFTDRFHRPGFIPCSLMH